MASNKKSGKKSTAGGVESAQRAGRSALATATKPGSAANTLPIALPSLTQKKFEKLLAPWRVPDKVARDKNNKNNKNNKNSKKQKSKSGGFDLAGKDPASQPFSCGDKAHNEETIDALTQELDVLQNIFYADRRYRLLIILQGTDASGKDGTLRGVFSRMSPLGVHTVGWKAPSQEELAHDYLWRVHQRVPAAGEIVIFNRSHYEDVLVPPVNGWITPEQTAQRYAQINDFERMLTETGTVVLKFMLHIGFEEQRERLQERIDDGTKNWKFNAGDLQVRKQWTEYQDAYQNLLSATSTSWAPWTVVPADSKTHRDLMIALVLRYTLQALNLRYPAPDPALKGLIVT